MALQDNQAVSSQNDHNKKKVVQKSLGVRSYDFRTVRKLSQIQRIRLGALHSRFANNISKRIEIFLKTELETSFLGLEQVQGASFKADEFNDVVCLSYELIGKGTIYSIWPRELAFFIIERMLGGSGEKLFMDKVLSEFERDILLRFSNELFLAFQSSFDNKPAPECLSQKLTDGIEPFSEKMPYEVLLMGRINLHIKNYQGSIIMVYPYSLAKPWIDNQAADIPVVQDESWKTSPLGIASSLANAPVYITVRAGHTPIKVSDFTNLQEGDCIQLNLSIHEPFEIHVENQFKFKGFLGSKGRQMAVKIATKINSSETRKVISKKQEGM